MVQGEQQVEEELLLEVEVEVDLPQVELVEEELHPSWYQAAPGVQEVLVPKVELVKEELHPSWYLAVAPEVQEAEEPLSCWKRQKAGVGLLQLMVELVKLLCHSQLEEE